MGSVAQNRPTTALLSKGSTGNPRTKAAAESAVRPAKEARRKSARQANRSPPRGSASPEIHTPKQRQRAFRFVESPESARQNSGFSVSKAVRRGSSNGMVLPGKSAEPAGACPAAAFSSGSHALGAGETRAAGKTILRSVESAGAASEQRIQRFEVGQARLVQRKSFAGEERAEPVGAHPAVAFRRGNTRRVRESFAPRGWTILRSVESSRVRPSSGFSVSKPVRRGSSSGRASPGKNVPSQPELVPRQRFVGKPRAGQTILRSVESSGVRSSSGFSASKPGRRGSSSGMVLPGKSAEPVGAHPAVAFRRGNARRVWESFAPRGWTILRFVESSGVRPSSGFSASKSVRRGSSSGRASPGKNVPSQPELVLRQRFAGKPRAGQTILRSVESSGVRSSSGFSASKPVRRGSSSGRSSPGSRAPERRQRAFRFVESPENARQSSGFSASKPGRRGSSRGRVSPGRSAPK